MSTDRIQQKIALFGLFGAGNLGNDCTLQATLYNLRRYVPSAQISCICAGPEETTSKYNISAFPIRERALKAVKSRALRLLRRIIVGIPLELYRCVTAVKRLKNCDMLLMTGTGMLSDIGTRPLGLHYDVLRWSVAAKLCRCKLLFVSVGVGPIGHPLGKLFVKTALRLADYRSYRDSSSKEYLERVGFETKSDAIYPDLAFSLPINAVSAAQRHNGRQAVIGLGLITHTRTRVSSGGDEAFYRDYVSKAAGFVTWLIERNYRVRLLIGDVAYDGRVRQDLKAILQQGGLKCERAEIIDEPARCVDDLLSQLAATDLVVASRFHNVLLALMLKKPVVAISFHQKVDSLMDGMGLAEFCQDIEHIDLLRLAQQFTKASEYAQDITLQIGRKTETYRQALERQYEQILGPLRQPV